MRTVMAPAERSPPSLLDILFTTRGSIIRRIAWRVVAMTCLASGAVYWTKFHRDPLAELGTAPFTLIGISISIFMSFRNGACYDRWWEGRKQWGLLIVAIRSLARETVTLQAGRERILAGVCGFAHALAARLRNMDEMAALGPWLQGGEAEISEHPNITSAALEQAGRECALLAERGDISEWRYTVLEARFVELSAVQAACERLKSTPLPFAYTLLIHRTTYLFCCLLPFGLATYLGWITPAFVAVVSYTFFGLDAIGDELENPFGRTDNALPLDAFVRTIEAEMRATLDLPEDSYPGFPGSAGTRRL